MSYTAQESIRLLKKAQLEKQKQLERRIDEDIQTLRKIADDLMLKGNLDSKGFYTFLVRSTELKYDNSDMVIERFCKHLEELDFIVPNVDKHQGWLSKTCNYTVRFRPDHDRVKEDEGEFREDRTESSGNSSRE